MNLDVVELLQSASWPAFLVDEGGLVRHANQSATIWFGPRIEKNPSLDLLWLDQSETPTQFLNSWDHLAPPSVTIQFAGRDANIHTFTTRISSLCQESRKFYLFQLFKMEAPPKPLLQPPAPSPARSAEPGSAANPGSDSLAEARCLAREVAIDLNNALTSILGHASLVLSQMEASHPHRNSLDEVEQAAERAAEVITKLVDFSRVTTVEPPKLAQPSKLNLLIRQSVEQVQRSNGGKIVFRLELEEAPYHVEIDDAKMLQAFVKVLENARETFDSYGAVQVSSRNEEFTTAYRDGKTQIDPGTYVCVEIIDEGPGMTPDVIDRMFEPFFTTKPGHRGLGLPWVYGILTNLGGSIAVTSRPNHGCAVRLYMPATQHSASTDPEEATKPLILMVDDEAHVLETGRAILTAAGYRVTTASSAQQALATATNSTTSIALVITDLVMPKVGGQELIDQLRIASPETPVLRISGYLSDGEKKDKSCLQKPFTSRHLLECVKQALDETDAS